MMKENRTDITRELRERSQMLARIDEHVGEELVRIAGTIVESVRNSGTVYACGNGGSASQAQHFSAELVGRFKMDRPSLPAFCLTDDGAILTSLANDYGYEVVFSRQLDGMARKGDCLLALSTSGNSVNIVKACQTARQKGVHVFALTGEGGGEVADHSDITIRVPEKDTARIQELHLVMIHLICQLVESEVFSSRQQPGT